MVQPSPSAPGTNLSEASSGKGTPVLWVSSAVPDSLRQAVLKWGFPVVFDSAYSNLRLDVDNEPLWGEGMKVDWIYALVTPFPTVIDGVTSK